MGNNIPKMPKDMPLNCRRWWKRILKAMNTDTLLPGDVYSLEMCCRSLGVYERMKEDIKKVDSKSIRPEDKKMLSKMLSDWEKILTKSFDMLLLSQDARNTLMGYMPL